ncbi:MAG: hypothetical protein HYS62_02710 [Candidatus Aenigmarchaeota archaeon]|nr:hypothetical protein [Candidatus Aenigmarchaeota archaeon]
MPYQEGLVVIGAAVSYIALQGSVCATRFRELQSIRRHHPPERQHEIISEYRSARRRRLDPVVYLLNFPGRNLAYLIDSALHRY